MKINLNLLTNYHFLEEKIVHSLTDKKIIIIAAITLGLAIAAFVIKRYIKAIHLNKPNKQKQQMIKIEENPLRENKTQNNLPKPVENKTPSQKELPEAHQTPTLNDKSPEITIKSNEKKEEVKPVNGKDVTQVVNNGIDRKEQTEQVPTDSNPSSSPVPMIPPPLVPPKKDALNNQATSETQKLMDTARGVQFTLDIECAAIDTMLKEPNRPESEITTLLQMKKLRSEFHVELDALKMEKDKLSYLRGKISSTEQELNRKRDKNIKEIESIDKLRNEIEEKEKSIIDLKKKLESLSHGIYQETKLKVSYQPDDVITLGSGQTVIARDYKGKLTHEAKLERTYPLISKWEFEQKNEEEQIEFIKDKTCVFIIQGIQYNCRIVDTVGYNHIYRLETEWNHDGIIPSIEIKALMLNEYVHEASIIIGNSKIGLYSNDLKKLERRLEDYLKELKELDETITKLTKSLQEEKAKFNENDLKKVKDRIAELKTKKPL